MQPESKAAVVREQALSEAAMSKAQGVVWPEKKEK